jgi:hypothetical protein
MQRFTLHPGRGVIPNMDRLVSFLVGVVVLYAVPTILCAPFLMYFSAGGLRFLQSLRIVAMSFTVMVGAILLAVEPVIGNEISGVAILLCMCVAGFLITRLAAREGVKKTGWLGVGAKSVLSTLALTWIIVGAAFRNVRHRWPLYSPLRP